MGIIFILFYGKYFISETFQFQPIFWSNIYHIVSTISPLDNRVEDQMRSYSVYTLTDFLHIDYWSVPVWRAVLLQLLTSFGKHSAGNWFVLVALEVDFSPPECVIIRARPRAFLSPRMPHCPLLLLWQKKVLLANTRIDRCGFFH